MKILICCAQGVSTSMLREKLNSLQLKHTVNSTSIGDIDIVLQDENYDLLLIAPQLAHRKAFFDRVSNSYHIPYQMIDYVAYGRMNAKLIAKVIDTYEEEKK